MGSESFLVKKWMEQTIEKWASENSFRFIPEYKFHMKRKWRLDWAIIAISGPDIRVGIEYEGIASTKSRHTSITGFSNDAEKYNAASLLGWKILRYSILNYRSLETDLKSIK